MRSEETVTLVTGVLWLREKPGKTTDILTAFGTNLRVVECWKV